MKSVSGGFACVPFATRAVTLLLAAFLITGCSTVRNWFGSDKDENTTDPAKLQDFEPAISVSRLWSTRVGKGEDRIGARQTPTVLNGRVYASAVTDGVHALDLNTGATAWHYRSDLALTGGPGVGDGVVVVGSVQGDVIALDANSGSERWTAKVGNEVIAPPAVGQGVALVRANDGTLTAFDVATGERRWQWGRELPLLTVRGNDAPAFGPGFAFVGYDDGNVVALSLTDGRVLWEQPVAYPDGRTELERMADVDGTPVLDDVVLFATSYKRQTMAIEAPNGRPLWSADHGGAGRIGLAGDRLVISDPAGTVWALNKFNGSALWQQPALARRNLTSAAVHGGYAVVGDYDGYLHWLRLDTGEFAARTRAGRSALRGAPVVADGVLVIQNVDGHVSAYRLQ